ncbi:MAG: hypothetical protein KC448_04345 [Yoonia sp.]|nr:hypothetical protein [Yoonia sp.]
MQDVNTSFETRSPHNAGRPVQKDPAPSGAGDASIRSLPIRNFKTEVHDAFGPDPNWMLRCFIDLGLSDGEIARYVGLSEACVSILARPLRGPDHARYLG